MNTNDEKVIQVKIPRNEHTFRKFAEMLNDSICEDKSLTVMLIAAAQEAGADVDKIMDETSVAIRNDLLSIEYGLVISPLTLIPEHLEEGVV